MNAEYLIECKNCGEHLLIAHPIYAMAGSPLHTRFIYPAEGYTWECPRCGIMYEHNSRSLEIIGSFFNGSYDIHYRRPIVTEEEVTQNQEDLQSGKVMMLWHMSSDVPMAVHDARVYFESKYGLRPNVVILAEDDALVEDEDGKKVRLEVIEGLLVATAPWVGKSSAFIGLMDGTSDAWGATV